MSWSQDSTDFSTQTQQGQAVKDKPGYQDRALKHPQYYTVLTPFLQMPKWKCGNNAAGRAGEAAQQLRALVSAAENPRLIPSTHMGVHNHS